LASNLWTDVEALRRLARSQRAARGADGPDRKVPLGAFPPYPHLAAIDLHAMELTSRLATGDFCDYFMLDDSELAVVMADVSGKGIPAAVLRGVTRSVLRQIASVSASPGSTLARLNRILSEADLGSMFLTLFLGQYRTQTGLLRYANAGHPPPLRIGRGGEVEPFGEVTGPILGILDSRTYADREEWLAVGDKLVLFTDGVTEARNRLGEFFAPRRLRECLVGQAAAAPAAVCAALRTRVLEFRHGRVQDDATVLVLQRRR
jgi:sigma-B regulation protein RsbU (phosphoserine phosphatase)